MFNKKAFLICTAIAVCLISAYSAADSVNLPVYEFYMTRHAVVDQAEYEEYFDEEMDIINKHIVNYEDVSDGCLDFPCSKIYSRDGEIADWGGGDNNYWNVDSEEKLQAVFDKPGQGHVTKFVSWCDDKSGNFSGCGESPGNDFIVTDTASGGVIVHEYGENKDFSHSSCQNNIMYKVEGGTELTEGQCDGLGGKPFVEIYGHIHDDNYGPLQSYIPQSGDVTGPYFVVGDIYTNTGYNLTIGPGAMIQFWNGASISSNGGQIRIMSFYTGAEPTRLFVNLNKMP